MLSKARDVPTLAPGYKAVAQGEKLQTPSTLEKPKEVPTSVKSTVPPETNPLARREAHRARRSFAAGLPRSAPGTSAQPGSNRRQRLLVVRYRRRGGGA